MTVAAVVLAAGTASRFGGAKQLAEVRGRPLVAHPVAAALAGGCAEVVVVVGHEAARVRTAVPALPAVRTVDNPRYGEGQAGSLAAGLAALGPAVAAAVVLLGDEPDVAPAVVRRCIQRWRDGAVAVRAAYDDRVGHPVVLDRSTWPAVARLDGDGGARSLLAELPVALVDVTGAAPRDVDTPDDLRSLDA